MRRALVAVALLALAACGHDATGVATTKRVTSTSAPSSTVATVTSTSTSTDAVGRTTTTEPTSMSTTTAAPQPTSAVQGTVTAGPTCPVERQDQPCPPQPVTAGIDALDDGGHTMARTTSDKDGHYFLAIAPGTYTLRVATGGSYPQCPDTPVTVHAGETVTADISCDTGIR